MVVLTSSLAAGAKKEESAMSGSLRFQTIEKSRYVLTQLYLNNREEPFFTVEVRAPLPRLDVVEEGVLRIDLERLYDRGNDYELSNGDRVYRTRARFTGSLETFAVDVIVRSRELDFVEATISMAPEAVEIFERIKHCSQ